jgi:hypothetical protein
MSTPTVLPKAQIQQRLLVMIPRQGKPRKLDLRMKLQDVEAFTGIKTSTLSQVARKKREIDEAMQIQLSAFLVLIERGLIVKDAAGVRRISPPAGVREPPRATIDLSGPAPRIHWSR